MRCSFLFRVSVRVGMVIFFGIVYQAQAATFTLPTNGVQSYTVELQATVTDTPSITIEWPKETGVTNYTVYRKQKTDTSWGSIRATVPFDAGATTYTYVDTNISIGTGYEYQVIKHMPTTPVVAYGYIYAGVKLPVVESRGNIILIIDSSIEASLANEIVQLKTDLAGDGWTVRSHSVGRTDSVASVKALIEAEYAADPSNTKSVFLLGRVPVPYAGQLNPDGHANHLGAWPADVYYGDIGGVWTDVETWPNSSDSRHTNVAGDGKFDQSNPPSEVELQVGRVDLSNMSAFSSQTELDLLRQYLIKNHNYKHRAIVATNRAILIDNFGVFGGESFALGGWRNFSALVGSANIGTTANYFNTLNANSYKWTYAAGAGTYTSISGFATTSSYVTNSPQSVFTMLFGSYFGDWDAPNTILRAPLASAGWGLVSVWSGRPQWHFYHMGLGETVGYSAKVTQNNINLYQSLSFVRDYENQTHTALMGDPTLRNDIVLPPSLVSATNPHGNNVDIFWSASGDTGLSGYHVYRSTTQYDGYTHVTNTPIVGTAYTDTIPFSGGTFYYMVRAVKLETTPSGSYYNQSQGVFTSFSIAPINQAPVVTNLASTATVVLPNTLTVTPSVSDDGLPATDMPTLLWTTLSGPGAVTFSAATAASTTMLFPDVGIYVVQLSASDGVLLSQSQLTVTVTTDTTAPSVPADIVASSISQNTISLAWSASTDLVAVTGYTIYRDAVQVGTSTSTTYIDTGLSPSTTYVYTMSAHDIVPNSSALSTPLSVTTSSHRVVRSGSGGRVVVPTVLPVQSSAPLIVPGVVSPIPPIHSFVFTKNLKKGVRNQEIYQLQKYLNAKGFLVAKKGPGSIGKETDLFGSATKNAVVRFQTYLKQTYNPAIVIDGLVGPQMRTYLNTQ